MGKGGRCVVLTN